MSTDIINEISFGKGKQAKAAFQQMLDDMRVPGGNSVYFDLNKIIPMPESLNIESGTRTDRGLELYREYVRERENPPADFIEKWKKIAEQEPVEWDLGKRAYCNIQDFGVPTWHEWYLPNWGTRQNAYATQLDEEENKVEFQTAGAPVPKILDALSQKYPDRTIHYRWASEDFGYDVGECKLKYGFRVWENIPTPGSRQAYEMAAQIWGIDLEDFDLYLTPDGSTYEYLDDDFELEFSTSPKMQDQER